MIGVRGAGHIQIYTYIYRRACMCVSGGVLVRVTFKRAPYVSHPSTAVKAATHWQLSSYVKACFERHSLLGKKSGKILIVPCKLQSQTPPWHHQSDSQLVRPAYVTCVWTWVSPFISYARDGVIEYETRILTDFTPFFALILGVQIYTIYKILFTENVT